MPSSEAPKKAENKRYQPMSFSKTITNISLNQWRSFLISIFLLALSVFLIGYTMAKPRLLILHSYADNYPWVQGVSEGIHRGIDKKNYTIRWHYMDTKRHPSKDFKRRAGIQARRLIDKWDPDVIVAIDDNAQALVGKYYINKPNISIVFSGVGAKPEKYGYDKARNVTGILETIPFEALRDSMVQIHLSQGSKKPVRYYHLSDDSPSGQSNRDQILGFDWKPAQRVASVMVHTFDEWKAHVQKANKQADFLLSTNYHTLLRTADGHQVVPAKEVIKWTEENVKVLTINPWGFYVKDGGMLSIGVSPLEQGQTAANMAIDIIDNKTPASTIPIQSTKQFMVYFRGSILKKRNVKLPVIYEAFARATDNFYN